MNELNPEGARHVAEMLEVNRSITFIDTGSNDLDNVNEAEELLLKLYFTLLTTVLT